MSLKKRVVRIIQINGIHTIVWQCGIYDGYTPYFLVGFVKATKRLAGK